MGIVGGELAYRFLRWYAGSNAVGSLDGSAYEGRSKLRVLLGETLLEQLRGKDVIDFGCGEGAEVIEIAQFGARSVMGVDIQFDRFPEANRRAAAAGVADKVRFAVAPDGLADVVVSIDSFEHFGDPAHVLRVMATQLRPGGRVIASFGPTWYHPLGGHLFSVFPWAHLVFTETALIRWRTDFKTDGATRFSEVAGGLNQMTIAKFSALVAASPLRLASLEAVPIRRLAPIANRVTREFTTAIVRCTLVPRDTSSPQDAR